VNRQATTRKIRFGDFELDLGTGELRKHKHKVRLQDQPFQILVSLLERQGEVVSREDIRRKLWPGHTIVEFDHSINAAVKRLRDTLQDSAEKPRFVETLGRRGYRFIAPILEAPEEAPDTKVTHWASMAARFTQASQRNGRERNSSIAVLPFLNLSSETENEYFSDGLAEELINELAHIPGLKVIARTSAFSFKAQNRDIREIAQILGVANVVEGSVRRSGARVRVIVQLIEAGEGTHLWSERYDREMTDIFAIQEEISTSIAGALRVHLAPAAEHPRPALPAYEAYLKARHCLTSFTRDSLEQARVSYEHSIQVDPTFAAAHSGLAMAYVSLVLPGIMPAHTAMPLARSAALQALRIDAESQEANAVLGMVAALYDLDWQTAASQFRLAMSREPISPYVRWYHSFSYLLPMAHAKQSVEECLRGMEDDPLNFMGGFHYAGALLASGNSEAGEAYLDELSALHVTLYQPYYLLALSRAAAGKHREALTAAEKAYSLAPWSATTKGLFAGLLHHAGHSERAERLRNELLPAEHYGSAMALSLFDLGRADLDAAAAWLQKAVEERDTRFVLFFGLMRAFQPAVFRDNARWKAIAQSLKIPTEVS
jgi:TolB-like protein